MNIYIYKLLHLFLHTSISTIYSFIQRALSIQENSTKFTGTCYKNKRLNIKREKNIARTTIFFY